MAGTFCGAADVAKSVTQSKVEKLHAKIGQLVVERDSLAKPSVDGRRSDASDRGSCSQPCVDLGTMRSAADQLLVLLLRNGAEPKAGAANTNLD